MKKIFSFFNLFIFTMLLSFVFADTAFALTPSTGVFTSDLSMGMVNNPDVAHLQEFLSDQKFYNGPTTGHFFSLTKQALIKFQEEEGIVPSSGYFGPKTRSRINARLGGMATLSREEQIALLQSQIKTLQTQLADLIAQQQAVVLASPSPTPVSTPVATFTPAPVPTSTTTPALSPSPTPLAPVAATTTPVIPVAELRITGSSTQSFPDVGMLPFKLGDIIISNTTDHAIFFNQFELDLYDAMNSAVNRNKTVLFKLRDGTTTFDTLISETNFTINSQPPSLGEEIRRQIKIPFPRLIQAGQTYTSSLWIENLDYVIGGSWRIQMLTAFINDPSTVQGGFTFTLTR